uniref:Uncharacterized protein n=1 Tax=Myoviridae sp. ctshb19 TaxID=2825194 RepID=A0A8S5UGF2_9CAUD|nr:MAG TPA: hypothetical protein [Myoviridae sp. ctshb19]
MSIEDILGSPEDYRAAQAAHEKKKEENRQRIIKKLNKRVAKREEEFRKDFEAQLTGITYNWQRTNDGNYSPQPVDFMWQGYLLRCKELPSFEFMGAEIRLPVDPAKRYAAIDELSHVFNSYVNQMFSVWALGSGRRVMVADDVERMCLIAHACLDESEYHQFAGQLVNQNFRLKALFK